MRGEHMLNQLLLVGLGVMFGFTLVNVLNDVGMGIKPASYDVSTLIVSAALIIGMLTVHWWERRR